MQYIISLINLKNILLLKLITVLNVRFNNIKIENIILYVLI
jgi:hypothetical protein